MPADKFYSYVFNSEFHIFARCQEHFPNYESLKVYAMFKEVTIEEAKVFQIMKS
jgi:hypothetical protein